jgi:hypothetical protein
MREPETRLKRGRKPFPASADKCLVTTTISPPIRILAIVGVLAAVGLGIVLFTHNRSASSSSSLPPVTQVHTKSSTATHTTTPTTKPVVKPAVKPAVTHRVVLLPSLPSPVAHALRSSKVVIVAVYSHGGNGDMSAVQQARQGAKAAHAGFALVNVLDENIARSLSTFGGDSVSPPAVLIVKRPGKIVNQFGGYTDSNIVEQAALNAGAGR